MRVYRAGVEGVGGWEGGGEGGAGKLFAVNEDSEREEGGERFIRSKHSERGGLRGKRESRRAWRSPTRGGR